MTGPLVFHPVSWHAPAMVGAAFTTRMGGYSAGPWAGLNLGIHVGDDPANVARNRASLAASLALAQAPAWLEQVHGTDVVELEQSAVRRADAAIARTPGPVAVVMVADCVPVLLCDRHARAVAAVHAGWRGLAAGVIESAVEQLAVPSADLLAWIGPAIGPDAYVVGDEVRACFLSGSPSAATAFRRAATGWHCNLPLLVEQRLASAGISSIVNGSVCVHADATRFYSYRRDGVTGRMAALIWLRSASSES